MIPLLSGANVIIADQERNIGNTDAGPFDVSFYFSPIPNPDPTTDTLIGSRSLIGLAGSATGFAQTTFPIPPSTPTGTYYICAITDSGDAVPELDEGNNTKCTTGTFVIGPDLKVFTLTVVKTGDSFSITDVQQNSGNVAAGPFTVSFYLSQDTIFDDGDIKLEPGDRAVNGIQGPFGTDQGFTIHTIPVSTPSGSYYVIAVSDAIGAIPEINELNNEKATTITFQVP